MNRKLRYKVAAALGAVALAVGIGAMAAPAHATPPPPLTQRYIISYEGAANCLDVYAYPNTGEQYGFLGVDTCQSGGWNADNYFQLQGSLYEIHPSFNTSVCLTFSTTQLGVSKTEACVGNGAPNQLFEDISDGNSNYRIYNQDLGYYLNDPHTLSGSQHVSGWVASCPVGTPGCEFEQSTTY